MKKAWKWIIIALILIGVIYLIIRNTKKKQITNAAVAAGIPTTTATTVANSSNPTQRLMSMGINPTQANLISRGINPNTGRMASSSNQRLKCPEGFSEFTVSTPNGTKTGCRGYVQGSIIEQFTTPS